MGVIILDRGGKNGAESARNHDGFRFLLRAAALSAKTKKAPLRDLLASRWGARGKSGISLEPKLKTKNKKADAKGESRMAQYSLQEEPPLRRRLVHSAFLLGFCVDAWMRFVHIYFMPARREAPMVKCRAAYRLKAVSRQPFAEANVINKK